MLTGLLATSISRAMQTWRPRPPTPSAEIRLVCQAISKLIESTSGILSEVMLNVGEVWLVKGLINTFEVFMKSKRYKSPSQSPFYLLLAVLSFYFNYCSSSKFYVVESSNSGPCRIQSKSPTAFDRPGRISWWRASAGVRSLFFESSPRL